MIPTVITPHTPDARLGKTPLNPRCIGGKLEILPPPQHIGEGWGGVTRIVMVSELT